MQRTINCLVVDDEPIARDIILTYCSHLPFMRIVASCGNALEAKTVIENNTIDLIFLDINMPVLSGIAFLSTLKNKPAVIFTTAYREYALDAFDLNACDYLLKPFSLERFIVAVDKALERLGASAGEVIKPTEVKEEDFVFIKADGKIYKVEFNELLFAEASGNYTKIVTQQQVLLTAMTFTTFEELLPKASFIRVHRSFIINKARVTHIEGNRVFINGQELPIGSNYKDAFFKELGI